MVEKSKEDAIIANALEILESRLRKLSDEVFTEPNDSIKFLKLKLAHLEREVFAVCFLDNKHRLIHFEEMFKGTVDSSSVYTREVIRKALSLNAVALLVAHNHPSGDITPSNADEEITKKIKEATSLFGIRLLDHIIVSGATSTEPYSFAESGLLYNY